MSAPFLFLFQGQTSRAQPGNAEPCPSHTQLQLHWRWAVGGDGWWWVVMGGDGWRLVGSCSGQCSGSLLSFHSHPGLSQLGMCCLIFSPLRVAGPARLFSVYVQSVFFSLLCFLGGFLFGFRAFFRLPVARNLQRCVFIGCRRMLRHK